jgi:hypothetical protein
VQIIVQKCRLLFRIAPLLSIVLSCGFCGQRNGDGLNNVRYETSITLRGKKREYPKDKINKTETNFKNKNIRDFCRGVN